MRTRAEFVYDAADVGGNSVVNGLVHYSVVPSVLGRLSTWPISETFSFSYSSNAITTTTGRRCSATATGSAQGMSICRPEPYFASFALRVFMRLPTNALSTFGQISRKHNGFWIPVRAGRPYRGQRALPRASFAALYRALLADVLCSNDPVCADHAPESALEGRVPQGAACRGCFFIAEVLISALMR